VRTRLLYFSSATAILVREKLDTDGVECVILSSEVHLISHRNSYYHDVSACGGDETDLFIKRIGNGRYWPKLVGAGRLV
jgi:hypothetical protein